MQETRAQDAVESFLPDSVSHSPQLQGQQRRDSLVCRVQHDTNIGRRHLPAISPRTHMKRLPISTLLPSSRTPSMRSLARARGKSVALLLSLFPSLFVPPLQTVLVSYSIFMRRQHDLYHFDRIALDGAVLLGV